MNRYETLTDEMDADSNDHNDIFYDVSDTDPIMSSSGQVTNASSLVTVQAEIHAPPCSMEPTEAPVGLGESAGAVSLDGLGGSSGTPSLGGSAELPGETSLGGSAELSAGGSGGPSGACFLGGFCEQGGVVYLADSMESSSKDGPAGTLPKSGSCSLRENENTEKFVNSKESSKKDKVEIHPSAQSVSN